MKNTITKLIKNEKRTRKIYRSNNCDDSSNIDNNDIIMSAIIFECEVTEYTVIPRKENDENCFVLNEKAMVINLMQGDKIITQTEIDKKDAVELAKLILLKYL